MNTEVQTQFLTKDQIWQDETTIYWYQLDGYSPAFDVAFDEAVFGIADQCGVETIVDSEGYPINPSKERDAALAHINKSGVRA